MYICIYAYMYIYVYITWYIEVCMTPICPPFNLCWVKCDLSMSSNIYELSH